MKLFVLIIDNHNYRIEYRYMYYKFAVYLNFEIFGIVGEAEVLQVFEYKFRDTRRMVAGCRCTLGNLQWKLEYKVLRNGEEVYKGTND